jgi:hypothetical protein
MSVFLRFFAAALIALPLLGSNQAQAQQQFAECAFKTGRSANLIIPAAIEPTIRGRALAPDSEIAVFTPEGTCAGRVVWTGSNVAMTIWGNDILTNQKDGMDTGDPLQFVVWDAETQTVLTSPAVKVSLDGSRTYYRTDETFVDGAIFSLATFTVENSAAVALVAPENGVELTDDPVTLSWDAFDGAVAYRVQVSPSSSFADVVVDENVTSTSATIEVEQGMKYYWRVAATFGSDDVNWSAAYSFSTAVSSSIDDGLLARGFELEQNYPNPFNPSTTIPFQIAEGSNVSLRIYNMLGQEVATLVDGFLPAGRHEARWEAGDLPSGMYLYRLVNEKNVQARTLTLIK